MEKIPKSFFERSPKIVAKALLGKLLVVTDKERTIVARIVETEAYLSKHDKGSHANKGVTKRNEPMFSEAGHLYVYFTYGMHWLMNFVTQEKGKPSGVLIRAVEPIYINGEDIKKFAKADLKKMGSGPARLTKWLGITGKDNCQEYGTGRVCVASKIMNFKAKKIKRENIVLSPRVGIDFAGKDKDLLLRYYIKENEYISKT